MKTLISLAVGFFIFFTGFTAVFAQGQVATPNFSTERGFYTTPFHVTLSSDTAGAAIRYTLDGTSPTTITGTLYSGAIPITTTTPLRAIAYKAGMLDSAVATHSYIFLNDVIRQGNTPTGYPALFSADDGQGPYPADYEMDPEVVENPTYAPILDDALTAIPSLSIVMDIDSLFDPATGIYYNALETGMLWERANSIEMLFPDGQPGFQVNSGLRIHGRSGRDPSISPKKSFRLYFRSSYGSPRLDFPLFDDPKASNEFDKLVLRSGNNNTWHHLNKSQRPIALYLRDEYTRRSQLAMGNQSPRGIFVHLYLNGFYWGIYNLVERIDDEYLVDYLGGDRLEWDVIKPDGAGGYEADPGDTAAWATLINLVNNFSGNDAQYQEILSHMDRDNFIDYIILIHYSGNIDWLKRNWYAVRRRLAGEKFTFIAWDTELALKKNNRYIMDEDLDGTPARIFHKLRQYPEFQMAFADRIYKHLFDDGALAPTAAAARFTELTEMLNLPVVAESARWGDYRRDLYQGAYRDNEEPYDLYTRDTYWVAERDRMNTDYFPLRPSFVIQDYKDLDLYPAIDPPRFSPQGGAVDAGGTITLTKPSPTTPGIIYYTTDGGDPRVVGGGISSTANNGGNLATIPFNSYVTIKTRLLNGNTWSALNEATFIPVQDLSALVINEIMYHPPDEGLIDGDEHEFIELTHTGSTPLDLSGVHFTDGISYTFPSGTILQPSTFIVLASNGALFEDHYGFAPFGVYGGRLRNSGERVAIGDALLTWISISSPTMMLRPGYKARTAVVTR